MAKPIEPTPVLKGADAKRLLRKASNPDRSEKKQKYLSECAAAYQKYLAK